MSAFLDNGDFVLSQLFVSVRLPGDSRCDCGARLAHIRGLSLVLLVESRRIVFLAADGGVLDYLGGSLGRWQVTRND